MKRETMLQNIAKQFSRSSNQFCEDSQGLFCDLSTHYKGAEEPQNLQHCFARIFYPAMSIHFTYTAHGTLGVVNSILGCSISFDKHEDALQIPLPLLTDYLDYNTAAPMYIPLITSTAGMEQAFACIETVVKALLPRILAISYDAEAKEKILAAYRAEIKRIFDLDEADSVPALMIHDYFAMRFTSSAFLNFLKGNTDKAIAQLRKAKGRSGYEDRLLTVWQNLDAYQIPSLPNAAQNAKSYDKNGVQTGSAKEFVTLFVSWLLLAPLASLPYLALFFLFVWIEGRASICLLGPVYNYPFCILLGFVTALALSYFTRFRFYRWFFKKDYEAYCELDGIQNSGGSDRLMKGFLIVIVTAGMIGCALLAKWNFNFKADGFWDNSKFLSVRGSYHSYEQIRRIYYRPDRVNDLGETLPYDSYVVELENGEEIDLYELSEISDYDPALFDYLQDRGVMIQRP